MLNERLRYFDSLDFCPDVLVVYIPSLVYNHNVTSGRFLQVSVVTNLINALALFPMTTKLQWELFDAREAQPVDEDR